MTVQSVDATILKTALNMQFTRSALAKGSRRSGELWDISIDARESDEQDRYPCKASDVVEVRPFHAAFSVLDLVNDLEYSSIHRSGNAVLADPSRR